MKTITFESQALCDILKTDYCVPVVILVDVKFTKEVQYSTPFGDSYCWNPNIKFFGVYREVEIFQGDNEKYIEEINCSEFLENADFKNEVDDAIENFEKGLT